MSTISFNNGKEFPTIAVYSGKEQYQNFNREYFDIRIPYEATNFKELKEIADDKEALSEIVLKEEIVFSDENASIQSFIYKNYTIFMKLGLNDENHWVLKIAQKTDIEIQQEKTIEKLATLIEQNDMLTECILEMSEDIYS